MQFRLYHVAILRVVSTLCSTIEEVSVVLQQKRDYNKRKTKYIQVLDNQLVLNYSQKPHISQISGENSFGEFSASFEGR